MLCNYNGTIVPDMNNNITYADGSIVFLNAVKDMSLEDTKKVTYRRLGLGYNDVEINITWRCLVGKHRYFLILIACEVDFRNMMELFVQSGTNMME
jgi:hypothetical protein